MPTRILREGIITSEAVNSLSPTAELFYRRLMTVADDYGRYYAHPAILRGNCYPLQLDKVSDKDVSKWLAECVEKGLIKLYQSGKHLQVVKFNQQCRSKSKFPEPVENELLIKCVAPDLHLITEKNKVPAAPNTHPHSDPTPNSTPTDGESEGKARPQNKGELMAYVLSLGLPGSDADWFWDKMLASGWRNNGRLVLDWQATIRVWKKDGYMSSQKAQNHGNGTSINRSNHRPTPAEERNSFMCPPTVTTAERIAHAKKIGQIVGG